VKEQVPEVRDPAKTQMKIAPIASPGVISQAVLARRLAAMLHGPVCGTGPPPGAKTGRQFAAFSFPERRPRRGIPDGIDRFFRGLF
jgi:hypothetical protein